MAIKWTSDLSVGVEYIDSQHKLLFEKANDLFEAGKNRKSKEVIAEMLNFLDEYTKQHFRDEEAYMAKINYPDLEQHKKLHKDFIAEISKLRQEYQQSGGNIVLIINANHLVSNWLTKHISTMDKKIGLYVKSL
ncbi:MAG TPA: hemerythrin family protein [Clostridiaceae bacterium]|nr:hemerythrin family protein [Clostridiaceae bacterium]